MDAGGIDAIKEFAGAKKGLDAAKKELAAAKKGLEAAKKELAAANDDKIAAAQNDLNNAKIEHKIALEGLNTAQGMVTFYFEQLRKQNVIKYDCTITYVPHEIKDVNDRKIPKIKPIPVNRGQTSVQSKFKPWQTDSPLTSILHINPGESCQISQHVINFLTADLEFLVEDPDSSEQRVQPAVNFFTDIVIKTVGGNVVKQQRNRRDRSSRSDSGSEKMKFFRADVIYFVNGVPLVRIEEKPSSKVLLLKAAQRELLYKISQDWWAVECNVPFVIGIAVAGNIWTFHRITCEDVCEHKKNNRHVAEEWFRIDTLTDLGRLQGVQAAVHIASLLKYFANTVHPRTV